jgi:hypothetical protein
VRRRDAARALALAGSMALVAGPASAQEGIFGGMQKGIETVFSTMSTKTIPASGAATKTETTSIAPSLYLNLDALVYPNLRLNAGGVWELNMLTSKSGGLEVDSTITRSRPFILLRSTNPVFSPGFGIFRREDRARVSSVSDIKLINDEYAAYLGWNPAGGPTSEFQFVRTHTFDGDRAFEDVTKGYASLVANYAYRNFGANYRGAYLDTDNTLAGVETRQESHAGRLTYGDTFFNKRLAWNAAYNINYQDLRTVATSPDGEVDVPLNPLGGLSALSDTPVTAKLSQNGLLIDGNLTASAGVDLGVTSPTEDSQARNIGLDFLTVAEVNRLLIWVDRALPFDIAHSFSWEIYSSSDNVIWKRETVVPAAPFGTFENRFEVDFPGVTARYVKVVTRPLSVGVPDASRYPDIFVTEVQPFLRQQAGQTESRLTNTTHLVNTDLRFRILDVPSLFYEGFYLYNGPNAYGKSTDTLSNGLSVTQSFARMFSAYARYAREQGTQSEGYITGNVSNATLTIEPLPTFRSSLLFNGRDETTEIGDRVRRGFFVQNSAQPYAGVDVLFGFGWGHTALETGEEWDDRIINLSGTIVPREHVSLTFNYDDTATVRSGPTTSLPESTVRRFYAAVAVDPIRTLHLAVGEEVYTVTGQRTRTTFSLSGNWVPLPDGALQFIFGYNEALRDLAFGSERNTMAGVRWNLTRRSYVDVSYQLVKSEQISVSTEGRILSATVRLFF